VFVIRNKRTGEYWTGKEWEEGADYAVEYDQYDRNNNTPPSLGVWIERKPTTRNYRVGWYETTWCYVTVEAESEDAAYEQAADLRDDGDEHRGDPDCSDMECEEQ
jgi:hypothetical protein